MKQTQATRCLTCTNDAFSRGLCQRCLKAAYAAIARKEISERAIIKAGKMNPVHGRGRKPRSGFRQWLDSLTAK